MRKSSVFWLSTALLFLGVIIGFLVSPVKGGMSFGNNNKIDFAGHRIKTPKFKKCCSDGKVTDDCEVPTPEEK